MWLSIRLLALGAVLVLASCAVSQDQVYRGRYILGAEVNAFYPCDSQQGYWASYGWGGFPLRDFYLSEPRAPYAPIYVEFRGHLLDEIRDGFALEYVGLIRISEVLLLSDEIPGDCGSS